MAKLTGLTSAEVADRQERGLVNQTSNETSRRLRDIIRSNVLTPFNGLITALAVAIWLANGNPINSLFFVAMLLNVIVGVAQEIKAKIVLDRLAIMVKPSAKVIRDGRRHTVASSEVVLGDYVVLGLGDQIVADGRVLWSSNLEIDESLLTGEADPVAKSAHDDVYSGSFVTAGSGVMEVTKVGEQSYSAKLATEARQFKRVSSELINATNWIMRWIARILIVVAPILIIGQLRIGSDWREAVTHVVAAIVGMIPEGLVLLTSMAFLLAVLKLARQRVLVQQLPAVETLARVNTLLLDKTGTLTEGKMTVYDLVLLDGADRRLVSSAAITLASRGSSPTTNAIREYLANTPKMTVMAEIPFSSQRKWSAVRAGSDTFIMGAPEIVLRGGRALTRATKLADRGYRVLVIAQSSEWPADDDLPHSIKPLALLALSEKIRPDARQTLQYFAKQGVAIKVISGDAWITVKSVAERVGLKEVTVMDARDLPSPDDNPQEFLRLVRQHNVFGRVKPEQKRQIAAALQADGDVVAMTGDGVNDALALKKADLGIAMASGSSATRSVAEVVLLDNQFSHLPSVLGEGRRVVANIERVANLFIIKNVYTTILALAVTALGLVYPFLPAQMTLIGALSIGVPAFFFALAPNNRRYQPGFLRRVLSFSLPVGTVIALAMFACYYLSVDQYGMDVAAAGTSVSVVVMVIGLAVLIKLAQPVRGWKLALILVCEAVFIGCVLWQPLAAMFSFEFSWGSLPLIAVTIAMAIVAAIVLQKLTDRIVWRIVGRHHTHSVPDAARHT